MRAGIFHFIAAIISSTISLTSHGQIGNTLTPELPPQDSLLQAEFTDYLNLIISQSRDSVLELDSAQLYKTVFVGQCQFTQGFSSSNFLDHYYNIICIKNVDRGIHTYRIAASDTTVTSNEYITLQSPDLADCPIFAAKLNLKRRFPKNYPNHPYFALVSFDNGRYLIVQEILILQHGGHSSGVIVSHYLERVESSPPSRP